MVLAQSQTQTFRGDVNVKVGIDDARDASHDFESDRSFWCFRTLFGTSNKTVDPQGKSVTPI
jgi:hypothetical protein